MNEPDAIAEFSGRADRYANRLVRRITMIAVCLAAAMWGFIGWLVWSGQQSALANARVAGRNLAAAFAVELTHTVDRLDGAMEAIIARMPINQDGTPRLRDLRLWDDEFRQLAYPAQYIGLIGTDGKLIFSNNRVKAGPTGSDPVDLSEFEHFRIQRDRRDTGLYISVPVTSRSTGGKMLYFSKRIESPDGMFCGVLVFVVPPLELTRMHERIDLGEHGLLAIIGTDDVIRVRVSRDHPDGSIGLGFSVHGAPWPDHVPPGGFGNYIRSGAVDPVERLFSYQRLDKYPLIVNVGLDTADILRDGRSERWILMAIGVGMTVLVTGLASLLVREMRRRIARDAQLAAERIRLELARARIQQEQAKLSHANAELTEALQKAEAANQTKSRFLANMSHELRTPLHAIIGFSELIQDRVPRTGGDTVIGEFANDILASGRHLLELINAILDISKVESGTERLVETSVRIADEVRASVVSVAGRARERGVRVVLAIPADLPNLRADQTKIRQILINLMSNAVKFTASGGEIEVAAKIEPDGAMTVSVKDTGIGMSPEEVEVALQPFGQVDNSLARSHEGTGLGLPLAHRLAELHGGGLRIDSTKSSGTTVHVWMPRERVELKDGSDRS